MAFLIQLEKITNNGSSHHWYQSIAQNENFVIAQENLQRVKEHYKFFMRMEDTDANKKDALHEEYKNKDWMDSSPFYYLYNITLYDDGGKPFGCSVNWYDNEAIAVRITLDESENVYQRLN